MTMTSSKSLYCACVSWAPEWAQLALVVAGSRGPETVYGAMANGTLARVAQLL